jgi:hypothetical protein
LALAKRLDEVRLAAMVARSVAAERAMKGGRDPQWALESTVLGLADLFAASSRSGGRPIAGNAVRSVH